MAIPGGTRSSAARARLGVGRANDDLHPVAAGAPHDVGRQRAEHLGAGNGDRGGRLSATLLRSSPVRIGDEQPGEKAEGRIAEQPAPKQLVVRESVDVERGRVAHRVVARRVGLEDDAARHWTATGPAGHLREQLERALGRSVVGQVERDVGRDHAGERDGRQVEALGGELRADQHVGAALAEVVVDRLESTPSGEGVRVEASDPQARVSRPQLGLHALRAGAEVADAAAPAARALLGRNGRAATVVAAQRSTVEVEDEGQLAIRAAQALAAVAAQDEGGGAAPVQEQDRLLAPPTQRTERIGERGGEDRAVAAGELRAKVRHLDGGGGSHAALDQLSALGVPAAHARQGDEVGRRAAQDDARAGDRGAPARHPARVVARRPVRLVPAVVLLVDDDEPEPCERRECCRPRADHDADLAPQDAPPLVVPLSRREAGVEDAELVPDQRTEPVGDLRDEAHLRDRHDDVPSGRQGLERGGEVEIGLAGGRDALDEELVARLQCADRVERGELLLGELVTQVRRLGPMRQRAALDRPPIELRPAQRDQPPGRSQQRGRLHVERLGQLGHRALLAAERLEHGALHGRAPRRLGVARHGAQHPDAAWVDLRQHAVTTASGWRPTRRSRSSQAFRPRRGAERMRLASATRPSASAASARPAGRSVPSRISQRRSSRDSRPGGSIAARVVPIGAR